MILFPCRMCRGGDSLRDRGAIPALDALMQRTFDARLERLAAGFGLPGLRARKLRTLIRLALDSWTWRRLTREGLDDRAAADLMKEMSARADRM